MWSRSLYHSILADHKPAIQINLEHLTYGRVCPVDRMKLRSSRPHESESRVQAASTFGSGFDNFARETTRTFKISGCLPSLPFLTLRAAPTYETQPFQGCRKRRRCSSGNKSGQVIDIVRGTVFVSSGLTACASAAICSGRGRSHPRLVGSLERHVRPPNARPCAAGSSSSAARPPVSYAQREYGGHVTCFWFLPCVPSGSRLLASSEVCFCWKSSAGWQSLLVGIGTFVLGDVVDRRHLPKLAFRHRCHKPTPHPPLPHPEPFRRT